MANTENPCSNFAKDMQKQLDNVNNLVKAPAVLMHHMDRLARKLTSSIMDDFTNNISKKLDAITSGLPNMQPSVSDAMSALSKMRNCTALVPGAGNVLGHTLDIGMATLAKCSKYANAPAFIHNLVNQYIRDNALSQVNALLNQNVFGQISKLSQAYAKFIATSGIAASLNKMQGLIQCVSSACDAYQDIKDSASEFTDQINKVQDKFKLDDNFSISNAASKVVTSVDTKTKEFITTSGDYVEGKYKLIKEYKWELWT